MLKYLQNLFNKNYTQKSSGNFYIDDNFQGTFNATPSEYSNNVIVNRCVNIIAQAVSHVPWVIYEKNSRAKPVKLNEHPLYALLRKPNKLQGGADFFSELVASKLLYGNSYVMASGETNLSSLYLLHPSQVEYIKQEGSKPYYLYRSSGKDYRFNIDPKTMRCQILHIKNYNPSTGSYGISCLKAASRSIELHNNTLDWNCSLLKNGARPTGALVMKEASNYLSDDQFTRLQDQLYEKFSGSKNAGKPLLLEGGLDWRDMSINPKDMDYIESKNSAAREIALAFGLPPQLLGISGDNTYSNMQEARLALWEETVIPLLDKLADSFSNWFSIILGKDIVLDFDRDSISALTEKRQATWDKISKAKFMTINEKRAIVGLSPIQNGDVLG